MEWTVYMYMYTVHIFIYTQNHQQYVSCQRMSDSMSQYMLIVSPLYTCYINARTGYRITSQRFPLSLQTNNMLVSYFFTCVCWEEKHTTYYR